MLMLHHTNEAVCTLFDSFITMLQDMLRAQGAYAELLGSYLHSKRKFLTDSETAEQFVQYLQATEKRSGMERVRSSGSMRRATRCTVTGCVRPTPLTVWGHFSM